MSILGSSREIMLLFVFLLVLVGSLYQMLYIVADHPYYNYGNDSDNDISTYKNVIQEEETITAASTATATTTATSVSVSSSSISKVNGCNDKGADNYNGKKDDSSIPAHAKLGVDPIYIQ